MGSDGDFEFRRQELAHMTERPVDEITDEEVMQSYEDFLERPKCAGTYHVVNMLWNFPSWLIAKTSTSF